MAGALLTSMHAAVVARYDRLLAGAEPPIDPAPDGPASDAPSLLEDLRSFHRCRGGGERSLCSSFAEVVTDDLMAPLEAVVSGTCAALARDGLPAGWRADEEAHRIVERSRHVAAEARALLGTGRVAEALDVLVGGFRTLASAVQTGPPCAAVRDSMRRLLPLLGCVAPATSARAWAILGLRGRPAERFADGSLVDEPAPTWPNEPLFPAGLLGGDQGQK